MRHKTFLLLAVLAASVAASVAGASTKDVRLSLVAYSTPREAYNKLIPAFQKTQAGNGVSFSQSYAASGDQARAVKAGLKADIVALSLGPDVDELVTAGLVDSKWDRQSYKGMVTNSLVVFVVRDGNPKKIKRLERPDPPGRAGRDAEPVHVGRRSLERDGRVRGAAQARQDRQAGAGLPAEAVQERRLAGQERPRLAADVQRRPRRRAAGLRERGALRPLARPGLAVRDPALDDPDREPDRGREGQRAQAGGERVPPLPAHAGRAEDLRRGGLPAGQQGGREAVHVEVPGAPGSVHDRPARARRLGQGAEAVLRSAERRSWRGSKGRSEVSPARSAARTVRLRAS